ncbi:MAG: AmmeMemoRadiSam system radical SAM enzyme [Candidatus Aminicenantes bacterium]|nr:AmmeMemoRadiSam system radical SAM enzyme [Candidatus Aminicenantes bacterium]
MKQALLFEHLDNEKAKCLVCAHQCILKNGQLGVCRVRKNIKGELYSLNYDRVAATHTDPIEKKPLYHFLPGSTSYSVAAMGCNFKCTFCQNNSLSMVKDESGIYGERISPEQLLAAASRHGSKSISYTYSEPTIYFELMFETAKLAKEQGLKNVMVTNGYMSSAALEMMSPYLDGANVDLKAFSEDFYRKYSGAKLAPVLETIKGMKERGIWVEVTTLLIPDLNTDEEELKKLISFILEVDENIPWHVSRFFPQHKLVDIPPTEPGVIFNALETGREMGLKYLYGGNIASEKWSNTYCFSCGELLIERSGYLTRVHDVSAGKCSKCGEVIPGVWPCGAGNL